MMRISMPLAGMDSRKKPTPIERDEAEGRVCRLQSEGELFYVDTDLHEDILSTNRHDHGHLGGVSLEDIAHSMLSRKPGQFLKPESIAETEAASRSSSQDSGNTEDYTWQGKSNPPGQGQAPVTDPSTVLPQSPLTLEQALFSLEEAQQWDFSKLEDCMDTDRSRQRSFSEPQLRRCQQHHRVPQHWLPSSLCPTQEGVASPPPAKVKPQRRDSCGGNINFSPWNNLQRGLTFLFVDLWNQRVEGVSPHLSSCTSTKTFEVSNSTSDRDALTRLSVAPDMSRGLGAMGSMTFTMHIATHRVISSLLGSHAEFQVCVKGGGRVWSKWQRFSKFKMVATCVKDDRSAMKAWNRVLRAQPHYRCLHPAYLAQKCNLLEVFLQQVMFAMPTPALLIHFVSQK